MPDNNKILADAKKALEDIKQDPMTLDGQLSTLDDTIKKNLPAQTLFSSLTVIEKDLKLYDTRSNAAVKAATALKNVNSDDAKKLLKDLDKAIEASEKAIEKGRTKIKAAKIKYEDLASADKDDVGLMKTLEGLAATADKAIAAMQSLYKAVPVQVGQLQSVKQKLGAPGLKTALPPFQKELLQRAQAITKAISFGGELDAEIKKAKPSRLKGAIDALDKCKKKKTDLLAEIALARTAYNKALADFNDLSKQAA